MPVRTKFICTQVDPSKVKLRTVGESDEHGSIPGENAAFWKWTPGGEIWLHLDNPAACAQFEVGQAYYVDFTPAE